MKSMRLYIVFGLVILLMALFLLAMKNDCRFNEDRYIDAIENRKRDSLEREQMNRLSDEITVQLDSISSVQNTNNVNEFQNIESIKATLNQIKRTGQRMINLMK